MMIKMHVSIEFAQMCVMCFLYHLLLQYIISNLCKNTSRLLKRSNNLTQIRSPIRQLQLNQHKETQENVTMLKINKDK